MVALPHVRRGTLAWFATALLFFGFLLLPLAVLVAVSFNPTAMVFPPQGFTLRWYATILDKPDFVAAAWASTVLAVLTAVISTATGVAAARPRRPTTRRRRIGAG